MLFDSKNLNNDLQPMLAQFRDNMGLTMTLLDTAPKAEVAFGTGLLSLYQRVFAEPPWNETYTEDEVRDLFSDRYLRDGINFIASDAQSKVVGFAVAVPANTNKKVAAMVENETDPANVMYLADLGVDPTYRRKGVASALTILRADAATRAGYRYLAARTACDNYGQITLMLKNGAVPMPRSMESTASPGQNDDAPKIMRRYYLYDLERGNPPPVLVSDCIVTRKNGLDTICTKSENVDLMNDNLGSIILAYPLIRSIEAETENTGDILYRGQIAIQNAKGLRYAR